MLLGQKTQDWIEDVAKKLIKVNGEWVMDRRANSEAKKVVWFLLMIFVGMSGWGVRAWAKSMCHDITIIRKDISEINTNFTNHEGRISTVEADGKSLNGWMGRIDKKLDKVLFKIGGE